MQEVVAAHHKAQIQEQHLRQVVAELEVKIPRLLPQVVHQILVEVAVEMLAVLGEQE
jgi:hypothetical protein